MLAIKLDIVIAVAVFSAKRWDSRSSEALIESAIPYTFFL